MTEELLLDEIAKNLYERFEHYKRVFPLPKWEGSSYHCDLYTKNLYRDYVSKLFAKIKPLIEKQERERIIGLLEKHCMGCEVLGSSFWQALKGEK